MLNGWSRRRAPVKGGLVRAKAKESFVTARGDPAHSARRDVREGREVVKTVGLAALWTDGGTTPGPSSCARERSPRSVCWWISAGWARFSRTWSVFSSVLGCSSSFVQFRGEASRRRTFECLSELFFDLSLLSRLSCRGRRHERLYAASRKHLNQTHFVRKPVELLRPSAVWSPPSHPPAWPSATDRHRGHNRTLQLTGHFIGQTGQASPTPPRRAPTSIPPRRSLPTTTPSTTSTAVAPPSWPRPLDLGAMCKYLTLGNVADLDPLSASALFVSLPLIPIVLFMLFLSSC